MRNRERASWPSWASWLVDRVFFVAQLVVRFVATTRHTLNLDYVPGGGSGDPAREELPATQ